MVCILLSRSQNSIFARKNPKIFTFEEISSGGVKIFTFDEFRHFRRVTNFSVPVFTVQDVDSIGLCRKITRLCKYYNIIIVMILSWSVSRFSKCINIHYLFYLHKDKPCGHYVSNIFSLYLVYHIRDLVT